MAQLAVLPEIAASEVDQVLPRLCAMVMTQSAFGYWLIVIVFAAALAALMSTADSALLSISSMFTKDIYHAYLRPDCDEAELTYVGKLCSWAIVAILVVIAIGTDKSLIRLLELKFEVLIQIVPCFFLGLYWKRLPTGAVLMGMIAGLVTALGLTWTGHARLAGFHAGVVGLAVNFALCCLGAASSGRSDSIAERPPSSAALAGQP